MITPGPCLKSSRAQLGRLLQIILFLRSGRFPNAACLAALCEVSRRTIYRDLQTLLCAGVPVVYRPARGGYEVGQGFSFEPVRLEEEEAVSLVLQALREGPRSGPNRTASTYRAVQKIAQSLPDGVRDRLLNLIESLRSPATPQPLDPARSEIHETLVAAIARKHNLRIWFHSAGDAELQVTKISPIRLALVGDSWRLSARSSLHRTVKTFRVSRIVRIQETDEKVAIPASRPDGPRRGRATARARLRFSPRVAPDILDGWWHPSQGFDRKEDGFLEMEFALDDPDAWVVWIMGHGDQVEVLAPAALRERVRELALRIARRNAAIDREGSDSRGLEAVGR